MSTPDKFLEACKKNDFLTVRTMLKGRTKSGLDINYRFYQGRFKNSLVSYTVLTKAAASGYTEIVRLLLECKEIDVHVEEGGSQAIHLSVQNNHRDITELLLGNGASVNVQTVPSGRTPLYLACVCLKDKSNKTPSSPECKYTDCVAVLLSHDADVNLSDIKGRTPLHYVCRYGTSKALVNQLISNGAYVNSETDDGETPLHLACQEGFTYAADALLANGADPNKPDSNGVTSLIIASCLGHLPSVELLVKHEANINAQNKVGVTALMLASKHGHCPVVRYLIQGGATVNMKNGKGMTALHEACYANQTDAAEILMRGGADLASQNHEGFTPLSAAASHGHVSCVQLLLIRGCSFDWTGHMSPLTIAQHNKQTEVVRVLQRFRADKSCFTRSSSATIVAVPDVSKQKYGVPTEGFSIERRVRRGMPAPNNKPCASLETFNPLPAKPTLASATNQGESRGQISEQKTGNVSGNDSAITPVVAIISDITEVIPSNDTKGEPGKLHTNTAASSTNPNSPSTATGIASKKKSKTGEKGASYIRMQSSKSKQMRITTYTYEGNLTTLK